MKKGFLNTPKKRVKKRPVATPTAVDASSEPSTSSSISSTRTSGSHDAVAHNSLLEEYPSVQATEHQPSNRTTSEPWMKRGFLQQGESSTNSKASAKKKINATTHAHAPTGMATTKSDAKNYSKVKTTGWKKGFLFQESSSNGKKKNTGITKKKNKLLSNTAEKDKSNNSSLLFLEGKRDNNDASEGLNGVEGISLFNILSEPTSHSREFIRAPLSQTPNHPTTTQPINLILPSNADEEKNDNGPFLQERSTKLKRIDEAYQSKTNNLISVIESKPPKEVVEVGEIRDRESFTTFDDVCANRVPSTTLQTELSMLLARLNRRYLSHHSTQNIKKDQKRTDVGLLSSFLSKYIEFDQQDDNDSNSTSLSNLGFIWDSILEPIAVLSKSNKKVSRLSLQSSEEYLIDIPPVLVISGAILDQFPNQSASILLGICSRCVRNKEKEAEVNAIKVQMLGIFIAIRIHLYRLHKILMKGVEDKTETVHTDTILNANDLIIALLQEGLPIFHQVVLCAINEGNKKTLLVVNALDTSYCILEYSSLLHQVSLMAGISASFLTNLGPLVSCIWRQFSLMQNIVQSDKHMNAVIGCVKEDDLVRAARYGCSRTVFDCWITSFTLVENYYNKLRLRDHIIEEDASEEAVSKLTKHLAGISLSEKKQDRSFTSQYGGIARTLGKQSSSVNDNEFMELFLPSLQMAKNSTFQALEASSGQEDYFDDATSAAILVSVCAWLSQRRKVIQTKVKESVYAVIAESTEICISLLRSRSSRCLKLTEAILTCLWSTSGGIPRDFTSLDEIQDSTSATDDMIPQSVLSILEELKSNESEVVEADPCRQILCNLAQNFLLQKPMILIPYFLSHVQFRQCEVKVIVSILEKRPLFRQLTNELCLAMEEKLLQILDHNRPLHKILNNLQGIFRSVPLDLLILRLLNILEMHDASSMASSAAAKTLIDAVARNAMQKSEIIIAAIMKHISTHDTQNNESERKSNCLKYVGKCSKFLVSDGTCDDQAFASIMVACGRSMLNDPSNSLNLTLFGAFIEGRESEAEGIQETICKRRVQLSVQELVKLCTSDLKRLEQKKIEESSIFQKLSPLLMLRRIPPHYYRRAHGRDIGNALHKLANFLALKLGLESQSSYPVNTNISSEERRLCADIAANSLPFSTTGSHVLKAPSGFDLFCDPIISSSLRNNQAISSIDWKAVKIALYIGCQVVQVAPETVGLLEYSRLINFAMTLLNVQDGDTDESTKVLIEAQTGCIEFIAISICAIFQIPNDGKPRKSQPGSCLIQELNPNTPENLQQSQLQICVAYLSSLLEAILSIISGKHAESLLSPFSKYFTSPSEHKQWINVSWPLSARICLMNALSIAMQRCNIDILPEVSRSLTPKVEAWLLNGEIGDSIRHPLCIAAALQCIFNSLQRTKSFAPLAQFPSLKEESVKKLFDVSIFIIEHHPTDVRRHKSGTYSYAHTSMRVAALKLLVLIVSISQPSNINFTDTGRPRRSSVLEYIPPSDMMRALSIIRGLANMDENPDVRKLATQLVSSDSMIIE